MANTPALEAGEAGTFGELSRRPLPDGLAIVFVPSLAALLTRAQQLNGAALNERQVLAIRDGSNSVVVHEDQARALDQQRGYQDVDPGDAWPSWLRLQEN